MVPPNNLGHNLAGKPVNETLYRGMIELLMYLTATRPDIQFSTILCVRYQSCPKESHLIAVKQIFKYLNGTPSVGLYYPKCSGFDLKGYSDLEYAGCNMDRKSTLGTCQILRGKLVCWSAKRQQSMAMSSVEAEYVTAAGCCANILSVNRPTYYEICKYLINCPLAEAFTKTPSVVYQNPLREFWCIVITHNPNPPINDSEARPLKEYLIKFLVMSGKKPLILNYKTFVESTRLDYAKGTYVSHPSLDAVKAKLAKIVENPILLDRTPVLKTTFPMAWRILFTFVIQVLCGYYSSTEQVKSIQQLIAYCLFIGIKVDIGDIIYSDLITRLINKSRQKYVSYPRFVSCALKVLLGYYYTQDESFRSSPTILSNSNFSKDPSKVTPIELTAFIGPEASGSLPQKRKKPKSKKIPTKTQVTPPTGPTEGYEKSHSVSSGNVHDPQDPKRNKQLTGTKLPSTQLDEGTRKSQLLPEGTTTDPKDSKGNVQPADKGLSSMVSDEGTVKTMPLLEGPHGDKDLEGFKPPADMEPLTTPVVDPLGTDAKYQANYT
ncbi:hypothetical protein Tco_1466986 [Tanacetum coccineum]